MAELKEFLCGHRRFGLLSPNQRHLPYSGFRKSYGEKKLELTRIRIVEQRNAEKIKIGTRLAKSLFRF